jgi:hypothetical protein
LHFLKFSLRKRFSQFNLAQGCIHDMAYCIFQKILEDARRI